MAPEIDPVTLYLGTRDGLRRARLDGDGLTIEASSIAGNVVRDISVHHRDPSDVLVGGGLRGWGLYHSEDGGETSTELAFGDRWVWGVTRDPTDPETLYVGTEPPMLFRSTDGGDSFEALEQIERVDSRDEWMFFHEPFNAGHVHAITLHPTRPDRIIAGIEHGGVLRSVDGGATFIDTRPGTDAHRIAIDPTDPDRLMLGAGSGLFESSDGGLTWDSVDPLQGLYIHSVEFSKIDPARLVVYVNREGSAVHLSEDGGRSWTNIGGDLPAARPADVVRFHPSDPDAIVVAGDIDGARSQLYLTIDGGASWKPVGSPLPKVWRLAIASSP